MLTFLIAASSWAAQPTKRPTDEQRGEQLYRRHCAACHGVRNGGRGPATKALVQEVPPLQASTPGNDANVRVVLKGKGAMPGYEAAIDRADAVRVLKYMNSLGPDKMLPAAPSKSSLPNKKGAPKKGVPGKPAPVTKPRTRPLSATKLKVEPAPAVEAEPAPTKPE